MIWWVVVIVALLYILLKYFILEKLTVSGLNTKHVFITGCDTGFGHLLALKLLSNGIPTFAGCLTDKGKTDLELKAKAAAGQLWTVSVDVTSDHSMKNAFDYVQNQLRGKGLWAVVCNAGIAMNGAPDDWLSTDHYKKLMDVNAYGVIRTCQTFKPLVKKTKGRIVIVTSVFSRVALPGLGPYVVSKHAVTAYADILRLESKPFGVTVHILEPGFFKTNLTNPEVLLKGFVSLWGQLNEETKLEYGQSYYETVKQSVKTRIESISNENVNLVVDAYYHALTSLFPRLRYQVGNDSKFFYIPLSFVPTFLQDFFNRSMRKAQNAPLPEACQRIHE